MEIKCPICGTIAGRITEREYFCAECAIEFNPKTGSQYKSDSRGQRIKIAGPEKKKTRRIPPKTNDGLQGLNYWRLKNGFTWRTLSELTGHSSVVLYYYSTGQNKATESAVERLCQVLGVSVEDLKKTYPAEEITSLQQALDKRGRDVTATKLRGNTYNCRHVYCEENGQIYPTLTAAAEDLRLQVSGVCKVCNGQAAHAGGYHFRYIE